MALRCIHQRREDWLNIADTALTYLWENIISLLENDSDNFHIFSIFVLIFVSSDRMHFMSQKTLIKIKTGYWCRITWPNFFPGGFLGYRIIKSRNWKRQQISLQKSYSRWVVCNEKIYLSYLHISSEQTLSNFYELSSEGCAISGARPNIIKAILLNLNSRFFFNFHNLTIFHQEKIKFYVAQYNLFCIIHKSCRCIY